MNESRTGTQDSSRVALWTEWGRLTRFLKSARMAFERESQLWSTLQISEPEGVTVRVNDGRSLYQVSLAQHKEALQDEQLFLASVLIHSVALFESACGGLMGGDLSGGVEVWGARILEGASASWADVAGGEAGVVEVYAIRNCLAHGSRFMDRTNFNRIKSRDPGTAWVVGAPIVLSVEGLEGMRARLRSFLRLTV